MLKIFIVKYQIKMGRPMKFYIYTDGAARGNPGESASGYHIFNSKHRLIAKKIFYNGTKTNNVAEYLAVIAALERVMGEYGSESEVGLCSDSKIVVNQLKGGYKVKDRKLKVLHERALKIADNFKSCEFSSVPRENARIASVDKELNELLDSIKKGNKENILDSSASQTKLFA